MRSHQAYLVEQFKQASTKDWTTSQRPEHLGTSRTRFGLKNAVRRTIIQSWISNNQNITYIEWLSLIDDLYRGNSYEERCTPPTLFIKYPPYRQQLPITQLDTWINQLEGWAEVDSTCQSVFPAKDMLVRWQEWRSFLVKLRTDTNINKRRASLVFLTTPITNSPDERLITQALENVTVLQHERDKLITKAISWVLRKGIQQHRHTIEAYLNEHSDTLPAIAIRETQRKLATGKK